MPRSTLSTLLTPRNELPPVATRALPGYARLHTTIVHRSTLASLERVPKAGDTWAPGHQGTKAPARDAPPIGVGARLHCAAALQPLSRHGSMTGLVRCGRLRPCQEQVPAKPASGALIRTRAQELGPRNKLSRYHVKGLSHLQGLHGLEPGQPSQTVI